MIPLLPQLHKREVRGTAKIIFFSETHIYSIVTDLNVWPQTKIIYSYSGPGEGEQLQALILEKGLPEMQRHLQGWRPQHRLSGSAISDQRLRTGP